MDEVAASASRCTDEDENVDNSGDDLDEHMTAEEIDNEWELSKEDKDEDFVPDHGKKPSASKTVRRRARQKEGSSSSRGYKDFPQQHDQRHLRQNVQRDLKGWCS